MGSRIDLPMDPNRFMIDDVLDLIKDNRKHLKKKYKKKNKEKSGVIKNNTSNFYLNSRKRQT